MQSRLENSKINKVIETTLKNLNGLIDVNTVIGKPIKGENGEYIIPFSKVTVGILMGGGEYGKINIFKKDSSFPYSAGNGAIISIKPCGFLLNENDNYKIISQSNSPYEKLFEKATEMIKQINDEDIDDKV